MGEIKVPDRFLLKTVKSDRTDSKIWLDFIVIVIYY